MSPTEQEQQQSSSQQHPSTTPGNRRYSVPTQQALFQAYLNAIRTGQIPMPALPSTTGKGEQRANHRHTISDAKRGVTYVGQEQLKPLPIPPLEETCQRYLDSVRPFLV
jgi:hypothetical protein